MKPADLMNSRAWVEGTVVEVSEKDITLHLDTRHTNSYLLILRSDDDDAPEVGSRIRAHCKVYGSHEEGGSCRQYLVLTSFRDAAVTPDESRLPNLSKSKPIYSLGGNPSPMQSRSSVVLIGRVRSRFFTVSEQEGFTARGSWGFVLDLGAPFGRINIKKRGIQADVEDYYAMIAPGEPVIVLGYVVPMLHSRESCADFALALINIFSVREHDMHYISHVESAQCAIGTY